MRYENALAAKTGLSPLSVNDRVQVTLLDADQEDPVSFLSRVEDISGPQISLGWPTSGGLRALLQDGDRLQVFFIKDAVYLMECRVIGRVLAPIPIVVVHCQAPVRKAQRRDYVRVSARVDVHLSARVVIFRRSREADPCTRIETSTFSISGAGFGIRHTAPLKPGSLYNAKFLLPDCEDPVGVNAQVVRCDSVVDTQNRTFYCIGFSFTRIKESDRRRIVSFVFRYQQNSLAP
jgi:c-di-GMP-binding flagellar brake protein YcgR